MTQIDILKMAIEAGLAAETSDGRHQIWYPDNLCHFAHLVAAKEREALAQTQEPVAREQFYPDIDKPQIAFNAEVIGYVAPQRTWVGLTDEEIDQGLVRTNYAMQTAGAWRDGVDWAIKQLRKKNNG